MVSRDADSSGICQYRKENYLVIEMCVMQLRVSVLCSFFRLILIYLEI